MTSQNLIDEATNLHRALTAALIEAELDTENPTRVKRLARLVCLAADRRRRRLGYTYRRVPEGVRGSRR